ncbi:MAG: META domain-containing protein, partial [Bacteroidota bacterium]
MKRSIILLGMFLISLIAGACRDGSIFPIDPSKDNRSKDSVPKAISPIPAEFIGKQWNLTAIEIIGKGMMILPVQPFTLTFTDGSHLSGLADCNKYGADYTTKANNGIAMSNIVATEVACEPDNGAPEYMSGLQTAMSYTISENALRIYYDSGRKVLVYQLQGAPPPGNIINLTLRKVSGIEFTLSTFESIPGGLVGARTQDPVPDDQRFTIQFDAAGGNTLKGSANCNSYSSGFSEGANSAITISSVSSTKALCGVQNDLQQQYYDALQGA